MATAEQLGLRPGDISYSIDAIKKLPPLRNGISGIQGGIPLDTPGAIIRADVGRVISVGTIDDIYSTTKIEVLWTSDPEINIGDIKEIHPEASGFIEEGDERLRKEMTKAGVRLQTVADKNGNVVSRSFIFSNSEEK